MAKTRYQIHSPFVTEFVDEVLDDDRTYYAFKAIEGLREFLKRQNQHVQIVDHGAGSKVNKASNRSIASLARSAAVPPYVGRWLFRMVNLYKPKTLLELGSSLGISALYQAAGALNGQLITIEGCPEIAQAAVSNINRMKASNIQLISNTFEQGLPQILNNWEQLDYVYIDGDHRKGASLQYFEACLPKLHEQSLFLLADIHWSQEMEQTWKTLQKHPQVTLSIDLFFVGVLFFRKEFKEKKHLRLLPYSWKPWQIF